MKVFKFRYPLTLAVGYLFIVICFGVDGQSSPTTSPGKGTTAPPGNGTTESPGNGTTESPGNGTSTPTAPTTTTALTTTTTTTTMAPNTTTSIPASNTTGALSYCQNLMVDYPGAPILPSKSVLVQCICFGNGKNFTLDTLSAYEDKIDSIQNTFTNGSTETIIWNITAKPNAFKNPTFVFSFECKSGNVSEPGFVTFQKQDNGGNCGEDMDCSSSDQKCLKNKCSCPPDHPVFAESQCFEAEYCPSLSLDYTGDDVPPSSIAMINCTCMTNDSIGIPEISINSDYQDKIDITEVTYVDLTSQSLLWKVTLKQEVVFQRRRFQLPFVCNYGNKSESGQIGFIKQEQGGECILDMDCFNNDQLCINNTCSCTGDLPAFVPSEDKCFPGVTYGVKCQYNEQCKAMDPHSLCKDGTCQCISKYWTNSSNYCITNGSPSVSAASKAFLMAVALSTILYKRAVF